jgi:hypothetical protein
VGQPGALRPCRLGDGARAEILYGGKGLAA